MKEKRRTPSDFGIKYQKYADSYQKDIYSFYISLSCSEMPEGTYFYRIAQKIAYFFFRLFQK